VMLKISNPQHAISWYTVTDIQVSKSIREWANNFVNELLHLRIHGAYTLINY
jgi:hypothetical protein